jgi:hypothetical protein
MAIDMYGRDPTGWVAKGSRKEICKYTMRRERGCDDMWVA